MQLGRPRGARPADRPAGRHHRHRRRGRGLRGRRAGVARVADQPGARGRRHRDDRARPRTTPAPTSSSTTPSPLRCCSSRSTLGADIVVHSATKYLAGHSDVAAWARVVTARRRAVRRAEGPARPGRRDPRHPRGLAGAARAAHPAPAASSGPQANAQELVAPAAEHPAVGRGPLPRLRRDRLDRAGRRRRGRRPADPHDVAVGARHSLGGVESTFERRRRWKSEPATIPDGPGPALGRHRGRRRPLGRPGEALDRLSTSAAPADVSGLVDGP